MNRYDHPLIRTLYAEPEWTWRIIGGRTQANAEAPEVLLVNEPAHGAAPKEGGLFA